MYIGYNTYRRSRNFPSIIPCSIPNNAVTAQFVIVADAISEIDITFCNNGQTITIDWGDGIVSTMAGSTTSISYQHLYQTAGTYCISVSIEECTELSFNGSHEKIELSTIPIESLGWGMLARYKVYNSLQFVASGKPFYDAIMLTDTSVESIDLQNYSTLSNIYCNNGVLNTIVMDANSYNNLVYCNLTGNLLNTTQVDGVLNCLEHTNLYNGYCSLVQSVPAIPQNQTAIAILNDYDWNVQVNK